MGRKDRILGISIHVLTGAEFIRFISITRKYMFTGEIAFRKFESLKVINMYYGSFS